MATALDRSVQPVGRRPTNVSLDQHLVEEAKALGINISKACESGLGGEVKRARNERWLAENFDALEAWNRWVADHGLPLERHRQF